MLQIPQEIYTKFNLLLGNRNIRRSEHDNFKKWLRYYFDFCKKYKHPESEINLQSNNPYPLAQFKTISLRSRLILLIQEIVLFLKKSRPVGKI